MKFLKLLQPNHNQGGGTSAEQSNPEVAEENDVAEVVRAEVSQSPKSAIALDTVDSAETKVAQAIQQLFESRRSFQLSVEENSRTIQGKDAMIQELVRERTFLESKTSNMADEISELEEQISTRKQQYDQLSSEFNAYKMQQGDKLQKLQDALHERELNNQQLLLDFNQFRHRSEGRVQLLESQARDAQVRHHHVEKKYQEALEEIGRLDRVIKDFAAQASVLSTASDAK